MQVAAHFAEDRRDAVPEFVKQMPPKRGFQSPCIAIRAMSSRAKIALIISQYQRWPAIEPLWPGADERGCSALAAGGRDDAELGLAGAPHAAAAGLNLENSTTTRR